MRFYLFIKIFLTLFLISNNLFAQDNNSKKRKIILEQAPDRLYGKAGVASSSNKALVKNKSFEFGGEDPRKSSDSAVQKYEKYAKVTLMDVVLETVSKSHKAKAAREKMIQAKIKLDDAYGSYYPSVDFDYSNTRTESKNLTDELAYNDEEYSLTISQNLYAGGATYYEIESLKKAYENAKNKYKLAIVSDAEGAIKSYFDVLFTYKSYVANKKNMDRLNEILEIVQIKYDNGAISIGDLSNIQANVANAESKLIKVYSKFNQAVEFYKYIVGDEFEETFPMDEEYDTKLGDFEEIVELALANNLNIVNYYLNIEAEKYKLKNAKAEFRPKIDFDISASRVIDSETHEDDGDTEKYSAGITFSYNLYNRGADKNKFMTIYSKIKELKYRLNEEIRKLRWTLSKYHNSVATLSDAMSSTKQEVEASLDMVEAYWEGFKLGEQDLQVLLQGQRQLNSAELSYIEYQQNILSDYFKLLSGTGKLLEFFSLDIDNSNFIDFSKSGYRKVFDLKDDEEQIIVPQDNEKVDLNSRFLKEGGILDKNTTDQNRSIDQNISVDPKRSAIDQNQSDGTTQPQSTPLGSQSPQVIPIIIPVEVNSTKENNQTIDKNETQKTNPINKLFDFKDKFYDANDSIYTIKIDHFETDYLALEYATKKSLMPEVYIFDWLDDTMLKSSIAYKLFDNNLSAHKEAKVLSSSLDKNITVVLVKDIKDLTSRLKTINVATQKEKPKPFETDQEFKKRFLEANDDKYTINIVSFSSIYYAQRLLQREDIASHSFVFQYGENKEWVKVMYGIFDSYDKAETTLNRMKSIKEKYSPVIEKISLKQDLYKKYNKEKTTNVGVKIKDLLKNTPIVVAPIKKADVPKKENILPYEDKNETAAKNNEKVNDQNDTIVADENTTMQDINETNILVPIEDENITIAEVNETIITKPIEEDNATIVDDTNLTIKDINTSKIMPQPQDIKVEQKSKISFADMFLKASDSQYTITLATYDNKEKADLFIEQNGLKDNSFSFVFGANGELVTITYGIFDTKKEALNKIKELKNIKEISPVVHSVKLKKALYLKYNKN
jgi:outer membrane protein TolC/septal ring-binding cell division protein DamX